MQQQTSIWSISALEDREITKVDEPWPFRYAISRSAEGKACNEPNQDYFHLVANDSKVAFAVCDGVSMSFCGQLAAQLLGERLTDWLFYDYASMTLNDETAKQQAMSQWLNELCKEGIELVQAYALPEHMNPIVQDVLEEKRLKGSESAFVAGIIKTCEDSGDTSLTLCWLGDIRIRLWMQNNEIAVRESSTVCTEERWSTHKGCIGELHVITYSWTASQAEHLKLMVYTDGLALLDPLAYPPNESQLMAVMNESLSMANSDDMTYVEIDMSPRLQDEVPLCL